MRLLSRVKTFCTSPYLVAGYLSTYGWCDLQTDPKALIHFVDEVESHSVETTYTDVQYLLSAYADQILILFRSV